MTVVSTKFGRMRLIDSDSVVSKSLAMYGEWAMDELNFLRQLIKPDMHVLDVGAYIGTHSLAFSEFVGPHGKVSAFEPRKEIFEVLKENLELNNLQNVDAFSLGLAEKEGSIFLAPLDIHTESNFGGHSLSTPMQAPQRAGYHLRIATVDQFGFERVDVIKLDVEGMERQVLDGAVNTILRDTPVIFCECNSLLAGSEILAFCQTIQYAVYAVITSAYNVQNFNNNNNDIFGSAKELSLVLISSACSNEILHGIANANLIPIHTLEDLVLPLLFKPQYPYEVLMNTTSATLLGINFPSPLMDVQCHQRNDDVFVATEQAKDLAEQYAREHYAKYQQTHERLVATEQAKDLAEQYAREHYAKYRQTHERLVATEQAKDLAEQYAREHYAKYQQTHERLVATEQAKGLAELELVSINENVGKLTIAIATLRSKWVYRLLTLLHLLPKI